MNKGWFNQGYRHSLAARGIKTSLASNSFRYNFKMTRKEEAEFIKDAEEHQRMLEEEKEKKENSKELQTQKDENEEKEDKQSFLFKKDDLHGFADAFKSNSEKYTQGHDYSRDSSSRVMEQLKKEMHKMEDEGYLTLEDNRRFMEDQYAPLEAQFLDRTTNANQFKDEVDRAYRLFFQHNRKKHGILNMGKEEMEPSLFSEGQSRGTSLFGF